MIFITSIVCLVGGLLAFSSFQAHTLNILLSLEVIMLSLLAILFSYSSYLGFPFHSFLILLTVVACEAALGLSLLVALLRLWGNDFTSSFSSLKF